MKTTQKNSAPAQPKQIYLGPPHHVNDVDIFGRSQTAIGLAAPTGWTRHEVVYTLDELRARLTPPKPAAPQSSKPVPLSVLGVLTADKLPRANPNAGELVAGEQDLREWIEPNWLHLQPPQFLDSFYSPAN